MGLESILDLFSLASDFARTSQNFNSKNSEVPVFVSQFLSFSLQRRLQSKSIRSTLFFVAKKFGYEIRTSSGFGQWRHAFGFLFLRFTSLLPLFKHASNVRLSTLSVARMLTYQVPYTGKLFKLKMENLKVQTDYLWEITRNPLCPKGMERSLSR